MLLRIFAIFRLLLGLAVAVRGLVVLIVFSLELPEVLVRFKCVIMIGLPLSSSFKSALGLVLRRRFRLSALG